jgi:hypothetical protein
MAEDKKGAAKKTEGLRFDHQLYELLDKNDGVFIGEAHNRPSLRQALTYLAPAMKAHGVTTLSIETRQATINSMIEAESTEEWMKTPRAKGFSAAFRPEEICNLVRAYNKLGIKVLGHEDAAYVEERRKVEEERRRAAEAKRKVVEKEIAEFMNSERVQKVRQEVQKEITEGIKNIDIKDAKKVEHFVQEKMKKLELFFQNDQEYLALQKKMIEEEAMDPNDPEEIRKRNTLAADYIKKNKLPGKVLILGGKNHSQHSPEAPTAKDDKAKKEGLDKLLGIPAVNVKLENDAGQVGTTEVVTPQRGYEVTLPDDLKEMIKTMRITSWPPPGGVPVLGAPHQQPAPLPAMPKIQPPMQQPAVPGP